MSKWAEHECTTQVFNLPNLLIGTVYMCLARPMYWRFKLQLQINCSELTCVMMKYSLKALCEPVKG